MIIDVLKDKYSLPALLSRLSIAGSSYFYQAKAMQREIKYTELRGTVKEFFHGSRERFGYRRIMKEDAPTVKAKKRHRYNSYMGEISPAVPNLVSRDFHTDRPNLKWLTDITEFSIKAGKVYLSPVIDCFDGMPVARSIGTSPNAEPANQMLKAAVATLKPGEKPIIHSARGCHYRWSDGEEN